MKEKTSAPEKLKKTKQEKYYKETFAKIPGEKRKAILDAAVIEFSSNGFNAANINVIAKRAGISIGSMYQYFDSKENLFLTAIDEGYKIIEHSLSEIDLINGTFFDKLDEIIKHIQKYSREFSLLNQLYLEATTQGIAGMSKKISLKMETVSSGFYKKALASAINDGIADPDISIETASFCIDNILLLLQFSYSTEYYKERMKIFAGKNSLNQDEKIRKEILYFLKKALAK
jgi:AcrR family transcriptional regulator